LGGEGDKRLARGGDTVQAYKIQHALAANSLHFISSWSWRERVSQQLGAGQEELQAAAAGSLLLSPLFL
jgi:hypothetical protein